MSTSRVSSTRRALVTTRRSSYAMLAEGRLWPSDDDDDGDDDDDDDGEKDELTCGSPHSSNHTLPPQLEQEQANRKTFSPFNVFHQPPQFVYLENQP